MVKGGPSLNPLGKPPGPNKLTINVKESIELCYQSIGGDKAFSEWAKTNPDLFYVHIYPKIIPKDIHVTGTIGVAQLLIEAGESLKLVEATVKDPVPSVLEHVPAEAVEAEAVEAPKPAFDRKAHCAKLRELRKAKRLAAGLTWNEPGPGASPPAPNP